MSVLVEALSVILRRDAIARRYPGGWPGFVADAVNRTLCADSEIARMGFMHPDDVEAFVERMQRSGFVFVGGTGTAVDVVVIDQREGPTTPCDWIEFFHTDVPGGFVAAARLKNGRDEKLICPDGWDFEHSLSRQSEFHPGRELGDDYAFVRAEHGTEVYRDRKTGKEVYITRPTRLPADAGIDVGRMREEHDTLLAEAVDLLNPFLEPGTRPSSPDDVSRIERARASLERVTDLNSGNWNAWWGLGIARRLLDDHENAYAAFARAYGLNPNNIEVGRNLAAECVALGYGKEAVEVSAAVLRLAPDQAGLIANHALALLINGDPRAARDEAARALTLDPADEVTRNLCGFIDDVLAGRTNAPMKVATW